MLSDKIDDGGLYCGLAGALLFAVVMLFSLATNAETPENKLLRILTTIKSSTEDSILVKAPYDRGSLDYGKIIPGKCLILELHDGVIFQGPREDVIKSYMLYYNLTAESNSN